MLLHPLAFGHCLAIAKEGTVEHIMQVAVEVVETDQFQAVLLDVFGARGLAEGIEAVSILFLREYVLILLRVVGREPEGQFLALSHGREGDGLVNIHLRLVFQIADVPSGTALDTLCAGCQGHESQQCQ